MLLARAVVEERLLLRGLLHGAEVDRAGGAASRDAGGDFQRAERPARVALRAGDEEVERRRGELEPELAETALAVGERSLDDAPHLPLGERLEHHDARAGEERRDDLEGWILRRRAEQHDRAALDVREQRVLLRLVEAVDLVDEQHGLPPVRSRSAPPPRRWPGGCP